jgi:hypothetical protein
MTYTYEIPEGELHKVSIKRWNKVFANRGRWPFVIANVYLQEYSAVVHYNISLFGKVFFWTVSPLYFIIMPFLCGFPDAYKWFKGIVFDKELGQFGSDCFYRIHSRKESKQWVKLMKLLDKENK